MGCVTHASRLAGENVYAAYSLVCRWCRRRWYHYGNTDGSNQQWIEGGKD